MTRILSMGFTGLLLIGGCVNSGDEQKPLSAFLGDEGPTTGACCLDEVVCEGENCEPAVGVGQCIENSTAFMCESTNGTFFENTACDEACGPPPEEGSGCCLPNGSCMDFERDVCLLEGGTPSDANCANTECDEGGEEGNGCCMPDGTCLDLPRDVCLLEGGTPSDASCANTECEEGGEEGNGCCMPDGTCLDLPRDVCLLEGGTPSGQDCANTVCQEPEENTGACCLPAHEDEKGNLIPGGCEVTTRQDCEERNGSYAGDGTTCEEADCDGGEEEGNGCCLPDGSCLDLERDVCLLEGGTPSAASCANTECEEGGEEGNGCCMPDGTCLDLARDVCLLEGGTPSDASCANTVCQEPEENTGACCLPAHEDEKGNLIPGGCEVTTRQDCEERNGSFAGDGASCENACGEEEVTGACCLGEEGGEESGLFGCEELTAEACAEAGGDFAGDGTTCEETECGGGEEETNGCCLPDGSCMDFARDVCLRENGVPSDLSCANTECDEGGEEERVGACCVTGGAGSEAGTGGVATCDEVTASACSAAGGQYLGDGTRCDSDDVVLQCGNKESGIRR